MRQYYGNPGVEAYDNNRLELLKNLLPENPAIFEAGGHYGEDTLKLLAKWPNASIITLEPDPLSYQKLHATVHEHANIQAFNFAVDSVSGPSDFFHSDINDGASSLLEPELHFTNYAAGPVFEVQRITLNDFCQENKIDRFDLMWLDLEGNELRALQGALSILERVKIIYTETNWMRFRKGTVLYPELLAFLTQHGFNLLAHWWDDSYCQGDAIFLNTRFMDK